MPPPVLHHTAPENEASPVRMSFQEAGDLLHFNELTGAMETSNDELVGIRAQLDRAIAAANGQG